MPKTKTKGGPEAWIQLILNLSEVEVKCLIQDVVSSETGEFIMCVSNF